MGASVSAGEMTEALVNLFDGDNYSDVVNLALLRF